jgi:hypothetical protein
MNSCFFFLFVDMPAIIECLILSSKLWCHAALLLLVVVSFMAGDDHWCTDISWVWWILMHNTAALLLNINQRCSSLLHQDSKVLHHQGSRVLKVVSKEKRGAIINRFIPDTIATAVHYLLPTAFIIVHRGKFSVFHMELCINSPFLNYARTPSTTPWLHSF